MHLPKKHVNLFDQHNEATRLCQTVCCNCLPLIRHTVSTNQR